MGQRFANMSGFNWLSKLASLIDTKIVGLYRDLSLAVIQLANGPKKDMIRKDIIALFKFKDLLLPLIQP